MAPAVMWALIRGHLAPLEQACRAELARLPPSDRR
ncbi:hypothetical protein [Siccirubricoccus phaeus]